MSETRTQRSKILDWLRQRPLSTLQAREQLFIMSIAARIFELKQQGFNIVTKKILAGTKKIAQYVLLVEVDA
jgi:Helix-turn-helix domain